MKANKIRIINSIIKKFQKLNDLEMISCLQLQLRYLEGEVLDFHNLRLISRGCLVEVEEKKNG